MKKGISIWSFTEANMERCFSLAREAGFEGVEIDVSETGEITVDSSYEDVMKIRKAADKHGISLYSVASALWWVYPMTHNDSEVREKSLSITKKQIDTANWLGCDTILLVPGMVDENHPYDVVYDRALESVTRLAEYAEEKKVFIGIENVWSKFLVSPLEMRDFIDKTGSSYVKAYFDVGNVIRDGYAEQWIRILGDRIAKVHFKDYRRSTGDMSGFVDLLNGDVDYPAVMSALAAIGYKGWATAELAPYAKYPEMLLKTASSVMDRIFEGKS